MAVAVMTGWIATERSGFTADIRADLRSIPLDASCDANGNMIDRGSANCVDIDGRFRVVHSLATHVFLLNQDTKRPTYFAGFSADVDIDRSMDDALGQFRDAVAKMARQQKMTAGR
jgi:hypothetical protein